MRKRLRQNSPPEFAASDFTNLPNYHIYLKLMIDGKVSRPFSAVTLPPDSSPDNDLPGDTVLDDSADSSLPNLSNPSE